MGKASLKGQMQNVLTSSFTPGFDKHSSKTQADETRHITSNKEYDSLKQVGMQLTDYCKAEYKIRELREITPEMVQNFMSNKAENCNQNTLDNYSRRLSKLSDLVNQRFKTADVEWKGIYAVSQKEIPQANEKLRCIAMEKEDLNKILNVETRSAARPAIQLASEFGLRVSELEKLEVRDIKLQSMELHIHKSKGGLSRDLKIETPKQLELLKNLASGKDSNEKLIGIKADSINTWLSRAEEKLGLKQYTEHKTGVHAIRKMWATERYEKYKESGLNHKQACNKVSVELGHGENRADVVSNYIIIK